MHLAVNIGCSPILIHNARHARGRARSALRPHERFLERRSSPRAGPVDFHFANLEGADLSQAWLQGADVNYARVRGASNLKTPHRPLSRPTAVPAGNSKRPTAMSEGGVGMTLRARNGVTKCTSLAPVIARRFCNGPLISQHFHRPVTPAPSDSQLLQENVRCGRYPFRTLGTARRPAARSASAWSRMGQKTPLSAIRSRSLFPLSVQCAGSGQPQPRLGVERREEGDDFTLTRLFLCGLS
jgi:hypothetical protein